MDVHRALQDRGLELPEPAESKGLYEPISVVGREVYVSGQLPLRDGELTHTGTVGRDVSVEEAAEAAEQCALNAFALLHAEDILDEVVVIKVEGYVASTPDFHRQPEVVNGASQLLVDLLGDRGRHTRIAVGAAALPLNSPVEISMEAVL